MRQINHPRHSLENAGLAGRSSVLDEQEEEDASDDQYDSEEEDGEL